MLEATTLRGSSLLLNLAIVNEEPLWDMLPVNLYIFIYLFVCLFIYLCIYLFILSRRICTITMHGPKFALFFFTFDRLVNPPWKLVLIPFFCRLLWYVFQLRRTMIIRGDWL